MTMIKRTLGLAFLSMGLMFLSSCKSNNAPAIVSSATNQYRNGEVVWRELVTPNPKAAAAFYNALLGWTIEPVSGASEGYMLIRQGGTPIGGIIQMPATVRNAGGEWICSLSVSDVDAMAKSAQTNGATVLVQPIDVSGRGRSAVVRDPLGAPFALLHSATGDPASTTASDNGWLWTELWSTNVASSLDFYTKALGATVERKRDGDREYTLLKAGDKEVAGVVKNPVENIRAHWVNYIKVSDPAAMVEKAAGLGAKVILKPTAAVRNGTLGLILDPTGAPVALQKWPLR
jgi:predicted enzyme related to lactoylglutathione lyase